MAGVAAGARRGASARRHQARHLEHLGLLGAWRQPRVRHIGGRRRASMKNHNDNNKHHVSRNERRRGAQTEMK
jgi:hypothetical protein